MKTKGKLALLFVASFVGLINTSVASASYFNTYKNNGTRTIHKIYSSKKKYILNKTLTMDTKYKLKVRNIYIYQVPKSRSNYKTWMKVTGMAYNNSKQGSFRFGAVNNIGLTNNSLAGLADTATPFYFSFSTSKSPKMLSTIVGKAANTNTFHYLGANHSENFELLFHSKSSVKKIGKANFFIGTFFNNTPSQGGIGEFRRGQIAINFK
ncbi:hypothetical protein [Levilactobacillus brevis]|uniref:hypothetical protein n=1 Tax=Levilactobacillus brevis TaxID=1580 RepID=UPI0020742BF8|nr:hypothetical protein [Levilactobacillus brevis]